MVASLTMVETQDGFSSESPEGQADRQAPPVVMAFLFNPSDLQLHAWSRLADFCILK